MFRSELFQLLLQLLYDTQEKSQKAKLNLCSIPSIGEFLLLKREPSKSYGGLLLKSYRGNDIMFLLHVFYRITQE